MRAYLGGVERARAVGIELREQHAPFTEVMRVERAHVAAARQLGHRRALLIKRVDQGQGVGDAEGRQVLVSQIALYTRDEGAQAVGVTDDEHVLAVEHRRQQLLLPQRAHAVSRVGQALAERHVRDPKRLLGSCDTRGIERGPPL